MITTAQLLEFAAQLIRNGREHVKEDSPMTTNLQRWLLLRGILMQERAA